MSIVSCPECNKKMSSKAPVCPNCGYQAGEVDEEQLAVFRARRLREKIYRLNMFSYLAITVFVAGFGWYWWASGGFVEPSPPGPFVVMGLSAVAYLVVRVFLFRYRHQKKALAQRATMSSELRRNL
jgi:hypothetical protein